MIDPKNIQDIIQNVINELPPGLKNMPAELEKNFKSVLQGVFEKLDLVTREEFDAQCAVLHRTREKLEMLEKKLAEMEKK